jgi:hypothetical protein
VKGGSAESKPRKQTRNGWDLYDLWDLCDANTRTFHLSPLTKEYPSGSVGFMLWYNGTEEAGLIEFQYAGNKTLPEIDPRRDSTHW